MSHAQTFLGQYHEPAASIAEVIDYLPVLPLTEYHIPHTLDQTARILQVAGDWDRAGIAPGKALDVPLPRDTIFTRDELQDEVKRALEEALGPGRLNQIMAEGAASDTDDALGLFRGWLLEVAESG